jgi:ribokinase
MSKEATILVVGSINMDLVVRAGHIPAAGETVLGEGFATAPGGKGANQAVAIARQQARCVFLGRVGDDAFGQALVSGMKAEGIDCDHVLTTPEAATGVAMIIVDRRGENSIVVASGANYRVTPDDVYHREELFARAAVVLLGLELPLPTVMAARTLARRHNCRIVLDPAPAQRGLPEELFEVDVISPNVSEAEILTGKHIDEATERVDKLVASDLIARGAKAAVLKLGSRGSMVMTADGQIALVKSYKVNIVDTTAAGDAFTAALAVGVLRGLSLPAAAKIANAAGALACTKFGAQPSMPTTAEILILMRDQKT